MSHYHFLKTLCICTLIISQSLIAQNDTTEKKYPIATFHATLLGRYVYNTTKNVDINGLHHKDNDFSNNAFTLNYMRVSAKGWLNAKTEVNLLANLADFRKDPKTRVLENAYVKYHFSPKLNLVFGQFRPAFGQESSYSGLIHKSIQWSNQYNTFGKLGWTSFQMGVALNWSSAIESIPFDYSLSIINGNGKNMLDNDNGKHFLSRLSLNLNPKYDLKVGLYGGLGKEQKENINAYGIDANVKFNLTDNSIFNFQIDASEGTNHPLYFDTTLPLLNNRDIDDYKVTAFHVLPYFLQKINNSEITGVDFSLRYEYLDENSKINSAPNQTITPMAGLLFSEDYKARVEVGMVMKHFDKQVEGSNQYDNNMLIVQLQYQF